MGVPVIKQEAGEIPNQLSQISLQGDVTKARISAPMSILQPQDWAFLWYYPQQYAFTGSTFPHNEWALMRDVQCASAIEQVIGRHSGNSTSPHYHTPTTAKFASSNGFSYLRTSPSSDQQSHSRYLRKTCFNPQAVQVLEDWYYAHKDNPSVPNKVIHMLAQKAGITYGQVRTWIANKCSQSSNTCPNRHRKHRRHEIARSFHPYRQTAQPSYTHSTIKMETPSEWNRTTPSIYKDIHLSEMHHTSASLMDNTTVPTIKCPTRISVDVNTFSKAMRVLNQWNETHKGTAPTSQQMEFLALQTKLPISNIHAWFSEHVST